MSALPLILEQQQASESVIDRNARIKRALDLGRRFAHIRKDPFAAPSNARTDTDPTTTIDQWLDVIGRDAKP